MERTVTIIKPDGVGRNLVGEVVKRLEENDLKIVAMKMIRMTQPQAQGFYAVHKERPFFESLTDFMTSGPVVVMVLEGDNVIERYTATERQVILYFREIHQGEPVSFSYGMRAQYPLRVNTPRSTAYQYYEPSIRDQTEPVELTVR